MRIDEIDKNLAVETAGRINDIIFVDVKNDPFSVYGLYDYKNEPYLHRLPDGVAWQVSRDVAYLEKNTAGGRVRFSTDSSYIAVRCTYPKLEMMPHMTLAGSSGFDIYENIDGVDRFAGTFMPPLPIEKIAGGYTSVYRPKNDGKMRSYTIHMPLYNELFTLEIGLQKDANLEEGVDYKPIAPVVYYGSSITQGGCASRPGNAYQNIISARRNIDHINLGFSGSACGEEAMARYIASLDMSIFVMDYDHNAPSHEHLINTHENFFKIIREKHPDLPVLFLSRPNTENDEYSLERKNIIYNTFWNAVQSGDRNVRFIDGYSLFGSDYRDCCTVDCAHPNDLGFHRMAQVIGNEIDYFLRYNS